MSTENTDVIFRCWRNGDVIALFPGIAATAEQGYCQSYEHVGQHGVASLLIVHETRLALPSEYADLKRELEQCGYTLRVVQRASRRHYKQREEQIAGVQS